MSNKETPRHIERRFNAPLERKLYLIRLSFNALVKSATASGIALFLSCILALIAMNSTLAPAYFQLVNLEISLRIGAWELTEPLALWVNDGLMVIFFLLVGLEIKREVLFGELSNVKKAALPVLGAAGGMIVPAVIYFSINPESPASWGWGIPVATDIAFAMGMLSLLGDRIPKSLYIFLVSLAIVDDIGAIGIIAVFFTESISASYLLKALELFLILVVFNLSGVRTSLPYYIVGSFMWFAIHMSGIHPTITGVLIALTIPARPKSNLQHFRKRVVDIFIKLKKKTAKLNNSFNDEEEHGISLAFEESTKLIESPLHRVADTIRTPVIFIIMPVFAFTNSGVLIQMENIVSEILSPVSIGAFLGLSLGKFTGIMIFSLLAIKTGLAKLPENMNIKHLIGVAIFGGMGFTMSIFIAGLAFRTEAELLAQAKLGILVATIVTGLTGYLFLRISGSGKRYRFNLSEDLKRQIS